MGFDQTSLIRRLTSPYTDDPASNVGKLAQAVSDGLWDGPVQSLADARTQMFLKTATAGTLDRHGRIVGLLRNAGEDDASYRLRISGEIRRRRGGTRANDIMEAVEGFLGATAGDVTLVENLDPTTGATRPAYFTVQFDLGLLGALGFAVSEYSAVIDEVNVILERLAAAGVKGEVVPLGGSIWDQDNWDEGVWGA